MSGLVNRPARLRPAEPRARPAVLPSLTLFCALLAAACTPTDLLNGLTPANGVARQADIAYAPGPRHRVDIYRPASAPTSAPLPMIVFLYGGNWQSGDKDTYPFLARPLAARGAVVVVPDYRLAPEVQFPAFLQDNAAAVAWAVAHAAALGADPRSIFLMGHSAGAYDAAMLALDPRWLAQAGAARDRLAGVIGLAGPYDFLPITQPDLIPIFAPVQDGPASQPITYVDGRNPPMLLLAGLDDTTVQPRNTRSLAARIAADGGSVETRFYPGIGHVGLVTAIAPLFQRRAPVLDDTWAFIERHRGRGRPPDQP